MFEVLKRLLDPRLAEWEFLNHRPDIMRRGELHHLVVDRPRRHDGALHTQTGHEEGHVGEFEIALRDRQGEDGGAGGEDGGVEAVVGLRARGDEEVVEVLDGREVLGSADALHGVEFRRAELHRLGLFAVGAAEDDDLAAHLGGELDGEVAEAADADDADAVGGADVVHFQRVEDGGAAAHEGGGEGAGDGVGDPEEVGFAEDGVGGHGADVQVGEAVHDSLGAEGLLARQALLAAAAAVVEVSITGSVASDKRNVGSVNGFFYFYFYF